MRTIRIKLYKFSELSKDAQEKAISNEIEFFINGIINEGSCFWAEYQEMERMQTPWFLGQVIYERHKQYIIETIEENEYEFTKDGKLN